MAGCNSRAGTAARAPCCAAGAPLATTTPPPRTLRDNGLQLDMVMLEHSQAGSGLGHIMQQLTTDMLEQGCKGQQAQTSTATIQDFLKWGPYLGQLLVWLDRPHQCRCNAS